MLIYDIQNVNKVHHVVQSNLRMLGVKSRVKKNSVKSEEEVLSKVKKIFNISLRQQKFDTVKLSSGAVISVPVFIKQVVDYLDGHLSQEGLFRKAGSQARQRELVARLDNGNEIGEKYNAIDVANCLKKYLRDLPEPLIPNEFHDLFVRCGLLKFCKVDAILMACLLLPQKHLTTLAFFMEFLQRVSMNESLNKMSVDNLAKVIGPNIMPVKETTMVAMQNRLEAHLAIVKILIENAREIGVLPKAVLETAMSESNISPATDLDHSGSSYKQKKKKHRSGSLTRMFNGLKKMVGKNGSPEDVYPRRSLLPDVAPSSPLKSTKKRKNTDPLQNPPTTSKKKRESTSRVLFPSPVSEDPNPTDEKLQVQRVDRLHKLSLHLDRFVPKNRQKVDVAIGSEPLPIIERRWSMASEVSRHCKKRTIKKSSASSLIDTRMKQSFTEEYDRIFMEAEVNLSDENPENPPPLPPKKNSELAPTVPGRERSSESEEYVKIPKSEYEEIKNRVSAIESRIHKELDIIENLRIDSVSEVQCQYEKTLGEASIDSITEADHLAKRLGKELKIRKSSEARIMRSPSARRIGNIRRRSQEKPINKRRVSRAASWHITEQPAPRVQSTAHSQIEENSSLCSERTNARLDFLHQQLCTLINHTAEHTRSSIDYRAHSQQDPQLPSMQSPKIGTVKQVRRASSFHGNETDDKASYYNKRMNNLKKTNSQRSIIPSNQQTDKRLQLMTQQDIFTWKNASVYLETEKHTAKSLLLRRPYSPEITQTGRASVAKLRTQNAGMVLAKAKLFDGECKQHQEIVQKQRRSAQSSREKVVTSPLEGTTRIEKKKKCRSLKNLDGRLKLAGGLHPSLTCDQENSADLNSSVIAVELAANNKTPHIKKPLTVKTPKSARSLVRRAPIDTGRTPLKAVPTPISTPKRQSPRNAFKSKQVVRNINID